MTKTMSSIDIHAELRARLNELAEKVAGLHWDLGGLTYEMAIRDHFRLDVLVRKAAELQEADAELGEVERLLADAEQGVGGQCRACGAPHSRGAAYCWRCGQGLMLQAQSTLVGAAVVPPPIAAAGPPPRGSDSRSDDPR
jgi:predicted transcriptional regulator